MGQARKGSEEENGPTEYTEDAERRKEKRSEEEDLTADRADLRR
ncbi:MAG: hypothetical protein R6V39_05690 [Desulfovibrionales bacterium]